MDRRRCTGGRAGGIDPARLFAMGRELHGTSVGRFCVCDLGWTSAPGLRRTRSLWRQTAFLRRNWKGVAAEQRTRLPAAAPVGVAKAQRALRGRFPADGL